MALPPVSDRQGVRARILRVARDEFAALGREGASVHVIGERAGVTAAMINYYFGGKDGLYDEVVGQAQGRLLERLRQALTGSDEAELARRVAGAYFDFLAEDRTLQRLLLREVQGGGDHPRKLAARFVAPLRALLAEHFGPGDDVVQAAISLFGAVAGYFLYEPLLPALLGADPLAPKSLARRRRHVLELAAILLTTHQPSKPRKRSKKEKKR